MALVKADLESGLLSVISAFPASATAAASGLADAYETYAKEGQSCAAVKLTTTPANLQLLKDELEAVLEAPFPATAEESAEGWRDALNAYWAGPPPLTFGATGVITFPIAGLAALKTALQTIFEAVGTPITFAAKAASLSTALDTFTKTITVTDASIPCGPSPIT